MKRAIVWIGHETLASLIRLHDGEYVHAVDTDWRRMAVGVCVAGPDLPDVPEAQESPSLPVSDYVDLNLRAKVEALVERWDVWAGGKYAGDSAEGVLDTLREVLAGDFDPRLEMHGPDVS